MMWVQRREGLFSDIGLGMFYDFQPHFDPTNGMDLFIMHSDYFKYLHSPHFYCAHQYPTHFQQVTLFLTASRLQKLKNLFIISYFLTCQLVFIFNLFFTSLLRIQFIFLFLVVWILEENLDFSFDFVDYSCRTLGKILNAFTSDTCFVERKYS